MEGDRVEEVEVEGVRFGALVSSRHESDVRLVFSAVVRGRWVGRERETESGELRRGRQG